MRGWCSVALQVCGGEKYRNSLGHSCVTQLTLLLIACLGFPEGISQERQNIPVLLFLEIGAPKGGGVDQGLVFKNFFSWSS